jgi:hypothetical protein
VEIADLDTSVFLTEREAPIDTASSTESDAKVTGPATEREPAMTISSETDDTEPKASVAAIETPDPIVDVNSSFMLKAITPEPKLPSPLMDKSPN